MKAFIGPYKKNKKNTIRNINECDVKIKVHVYDLLNTDMTIAMLIIPLLKKLRNTNTGCHAVSNKDVPKHLRSEFHFNRDKWNWILDELIWTFTQITHDVIFSPKKEKRISNGLKLFGKYYRHLWT